MADLATLITAYQQQLTDTLKASLTAKGVELTADIIQGIDDDSKRLADALKAVLQGVEITVPITVPAQTAAASVTVPAQTAAASVTVPAQTANITGTDSQGGVITGSASVTQKTATGEAVVTQQTAIGAAQVVQQSITATGTVK